MARSRDWASSYDADIASWTGNEVCIPWKAAWRLRCRGVTFWDIAITSSGNKSEACRWYFRDFMRHKKILLPHESKILWERFKQRGSGRWHLDGRSVYVYYERNDACGQVRAFDEDLFTKKELKSVVSTMLKVAQLELDYKKQGRDGRWV